MQKKIIIENQYEIKIALAEKLFNEDNLSECNYVLSEIESENQILTSVWYFNSLRLHLKSTIEYLTNSPQVDEDD